MVIRDAVKGSELTRLDPHGLLLRACERAGVELVTDASVTLYENAVDGTRMTVALGEIHEADVMIAADDLHFVARKLFVADQPVSSA